MSIFKNRWAQGAAAFAVVAAIFFAYQSNDEAQVDSETDTPAESTAKDNTQPSEQSSVEAETEQVVNEKVTVDEIQAVSNPKTVYIKDEGVELTEVEVQQ